MKYNLETVKRILRDFLGEVEKVKSIRKSISAPQPVASFTIKDKMPEFDVSEFTPAPDTYWDKEDAYSWLYADAWNFRSFMHRPKPHPIPEYYNEPARPLYEQWRMESKEVFHRTCAQIPLPAQEISLIEYLQKLAINVTEENEHRDVWIESLRSFLQFLREDMEIDQRGALEMLFPSKESCKGMEFRKGYTFKQKEGEIAEDECQYILRRVEETVRAIDILAASEILRHLAKTVLEGRSDSQRSAAEALGFAWLCHAVGCSGLVTREDLVFSAEVNNFKILGDSKARHQPTHFIGIPSLFGTSDVPISKNIYEFLLALPRDPGSSRIFSMDWETVLRTFRNKGVKRSERARHLGQITFLTFMSRPHEAIGHRASLKPSSIKKTVTHQAI